jgi:hypothetical protein
MNQLHRCTLMAVFTLIHNLLFPMPGMGESAQGAGNFYDETIQ